MVLRPVVSFDESDRTATISIEIREEIMKVGDLVKLNPEQSMHHVPWDTVGVIVELIPQDDYKNLFRVQWSDTTMLQNAHWEQELETVSASR